MTRLIIMLALLVPPGFAPAEMTASTLGADLDLIETHELTPEQGMHLLLGAGFVEGAGEMGNGLLFCLPPDVSNPQLLAVMHEFLHRAPDRGNEPAVRLVREAFATAFPCGLGQAR